MAKGERLSLNVIGMLVLNDEITPELADQVIESVRVRSVFKVPEAVKDTLKDRTR